MPRSVSLRVSGSVAPSAAKFRTLPRHPVVVYDLTTTIEHVLCVTIGKLAISLN